MLIVVENRLRSGRFIIDHNNLDKYKLSWFRDKGYIKLSVDNGKQLNPFQCIISEYEARSFLRLTDNECGTLYSYDSGYDRWVRRFPAYSWSIKESYDNNEYNIYLDNHIRNVQRAYKLLVDNAIVKQTLEIDQAIKAHDKSKYNPEEYVPYGEYFYGKKDEDSFNVAWNIHQKGNKHHWQYWVLIEDEGKTVALDMPYEYIVEMICDWLSFSIDKQDLSCIKKWYSEHKSKQIMSKNTRKIVEEILSKIEGIVL